jgi:hypothetical protein
MHVHMHVLSSRVIISGTRQGTYGEQPMRRTQNGMAAEDLTGAVWQKSRHSNANGTCMEFAALPDGEVAVRNSRFPDGPALIYTRAEIESMIIGVKAGEFDHLMP